MAMDWERSSIPLQKKKEQVIQDTLTKNKSSSLHERRRMPLAASTQFRDAATEIFNEGEE